MTSIMQFRASKRQRLAARLLVAVLLLGPSCFMRSAAGQNAQTVSHRAPLLGADLLYANSYSPLIDAWQNKQEGDEMAAAFKAAGLKTLRFSSHGFYSARGEEATRQVKAENKLTNQFPWFPLDNYADFIAAHDFTTVFGVNVEEGAQAA